MDERFVEFWSASGRVHRAVSLAGKLEIAAKEICLLVRARATVVKIAELDGQIGSRVASPVCVLIDDDQTPDIMLPLLDKDGVEFGVVELYADPARPFDDDDRKVA